MKYHTLHDLRTSSPFKEKLSDQFKDFDKLKLLTNVDLNLTQSPGGLSVERLTLYS